MSVVIVGLLLNQPETTLYERAGGIELRGAVDPKEHILPTWRPGHAKAEGFYGIMQNGKPVLVNHAKNGCTQGTITGPPCTILDYDLFLPLQTRRI